MLFITDRQVKGGGFRMVSGDIKRINLSISSFQQMIEGGFLYIDKTRLIENFLNTASSVQLVVRQRRLGKSLNIDMLRCFLTDKEDNRHLFKNLYIENSIVWDKINSVPVFYFNFKSLKLGNYKQVLYDIVSEHIETYCSDTKLSKLTRRYLSDDNFDDTKGLYYLIESVFRATGKRSYILIDEYDSMLMDNYKSSEYKEIREFEKAFLEEGLKDNRYLEKALLTGVMRVSHESMLSGLNNLVTYDVFMDDVYKNDYGLTNSEIEELRTLASLDVDELRKWYNGVKISGQEIYNIYSVMSFLTRKKYECYWGKSGTMNMISDKLNEGRQETIKKLLNGEYVSVSIEDKISLENFASDIGDEAFYSFLVQAGYLALDNTKISANNTVTVSIPNTELMLVWKRFIFANLFSDAPNFRTLFDNSNNPILFAKDIEYFLQDRLSIHDLSVYKSENAEKVYEKIYHTFVLGLLSGYEDTKCPRPLSNRESGDGRYDILVQRPTENYIFEFKSCSENEDLLKHAEKALNQINTKRYGADLTDGKPLVKIGIAVCGKRCRVVCGC